MNKTKLRLLLGLFFLALVVPTSILIYQALSQMKWEAFRQQQIQAEELATRIDKQITQLILKEEQRSFTEYSFLNVAGDTRSNFLQRSPLAEFPIRVDLPGVTGYFQIDNHGKFSTPLLPSRGSSAYGVSAEEQQQRQAQQQKIERILSSNRLVARQRSKDDMLEMEEKIAGAAIELDALSMADTDASTPSPQRFDELKKSEHRNFNTLGRVEELQLESQFADATAVTPQEKGVAKVLKQKRVARKEQAFLPTTTSSQQEAPRITTFESEIDPFSFNQLDSGHFVLFRKVWRDGKRYTQGILVQPKIFIQGLIETTFKETQLSRHSNLIISYQGDVLSVLNGNQYRNSYTSAAELQGELLYQTRLSAPLGEMQLIFSINNLPMGSGAPVIVWTTLILALILCGGFYLIYRAALKQMELSQQQQNFISAVSHELKTPLTSIRMYSEMLREGWADEEKKRSYYDYIHDESERLTRLINNVLQLAKMTRNTLQLRLKPVQAEELLDIIRSKVSSQLQQSGFKLNLKNNLSNQKLTLELDTDAFTQIIINLVDNAIKFSSNAEIKQIDITCKQLRNSVEFSIRDYGPGIAKEQIKKIFKLFYRPENELTRETVGTGIGLALVRQLTTKMDGKIDVINREPGAEFNVSFPFYKK